MKRKVLSLFLILSLLGSLLTLPAAAVKANFSDMPESTAWSYAALSAAVENGLLQGSGGKLSPTAKVTRAEFAQLMYRMVSGYFTKAGTYTSVPSGTLVVGVTGVTLSGVTVTGDLVAGDGIGSGDLTLDNVRLTGRLIVRGGGVNSIIIRNSSSVGSIIVGKTGDGGIRVRTEEGCRVDTVEVDDGKDNVILAGTFNQVTVNTDAPVVLREATVTGLTVNSAGASVALTEGSSVSAAKIVETAAGAKVEVAAGTRVAALETAAQNVTVSGSGTVSSAAVSGSNTAVNVAGTRVTVADGTTGVTQNGASVAPPASAGTGTGGAGGGSVQTEITVTSDAQLVAALKNAQYTTIRVGDRTGTADLSFTIPASAGTLTLGANRELYLMQNSDGNPTKLTIESGAVLQIDGYLLVDGYLRCDGALTVGAAMEIGREGVVENRGAFTVGSPCFMFENRGFIANAGTFDKNASGSGINYGESRDYTAAAAPSAAPTLLAADLTVSANTSVPSALFVPMGVRIEVAPSAALTLDADTRVAGGLWCVAAGGSSAGSLTVSADKTLTILSGDNGTGSDPRSANGTVSVFCGTLTNSGTIDVVHGLLHVYGSGSSFVNTGVVRSSGGLVSFAGWDAASACASVTNNGAYRAGPYAGPDNFSLTDGDNSDVEQEYLDVSTEAGLRQAMADGAAAGLEADITVSADLTLTRPVAVWSSSKDGTDNDLTLTAANGATLTLGEGGDLKLLGTLAVSNGGRFVNGAASGGIVGGAGSRLAVEAGGVFTNSNHFGMLGTISNSGAFTVTASGGASHLWLVGGTLNNSGSFTNEQTVQAWTYTESGTSTPASIVNSGTFNNGALASAGGSSGRLQMTGGSLSNTGTFVNNGSMTLDGTALTHSGGSFTAYDSSGLELTGGSFDLSAAPEDTFTNEGYMKIVDTYGRTGGDSVCAIDLGSETAFVNGSNWLDYTAAVYSADGLTAAETAQNDKMTALGGGTNYCGLSVYDRLDFRTNLSFSASKELNAFGMYWVVTDDDGKAVTLTVVPGAVLTVGAGSALHIDGGSLVVSGTLVTASGGAVEIWPSGSFSQSETVTNGGEFWVHVIETDNAAFARTGSLTGIPADTRYAAIVHTGAGLAAALASVSPVYGRVEIKDDSNITLTGNTTLAQDVYIEPGSGLIVPHGLMLTCNAGHSFDNSGDVTVWGDMTIAGNFNNKQNLEIGAVSGGEAATLTVSGKLSNSGSVTVRATGTLDAYAGSYSGNKPTVETGGTYKSPAPKD